MVKLNTNLTSSEQEVIYRFLTNLIMGFIKDLKPRHIHYYAKNNKAIDPKFFFESIPPDILTKIRPAIRSNKKIIDQIITYDNVLKQCRMKRPDLYHALQNPEYQDWLKKFLVLIKKRTFTL